MISYKTCLEWKVPSTTVSPPGLEVPKLTQTITLPLLFFTVWIDALFLKCCVTCLLDVMLNFPPPSNSAFY